MTKEQKKINVEQLLKKYNLFIPEIIKIGYHISIMRNEAETLVSKVSGLKDLSESDLAHTLYQLILKCDSENPNFDAKVYEEMARQGYDADKFPGGYNHGIWTGRLDDFGMGNEITSIYDDYVDSLWDKEEKSK